MSYAVAVPLISQARRAGPCALTVEMRCTYLHARFKNRALDGMISVVLLWRTIFFGRNFIFYVSIGLQFVLRATSPELGNLLLPPPSQ